ncbi:MAG: hypothetical protein AB8G16_06810 [Gammaproteobacteria bacterium]
MKKLLVTFFAVIACNSALAWEYFNDVTIDKLIQWNGDGKAMVIFSDNNRCYSPVEEKAMYALLLAMYTSQQTIDAVCYDTAETLSGFTNVHKLHRIVAQ